MSKIVTNQISPRSGDTVTVTEKLNVQGVLTYEDVTNIDSVGIITAQSGVSIADSIFHTGDTNTAIRFPAADTFTVETGGSERVRVTSAGNVGIATASPDNQLHVFGATTSAIKIETGDGDFNPILIQENPDRTWHTGLRGDVSDSWVVRDATASSNRVVIDTSGNSTFSGTISDSKGDVRDIPQSSNSSQRTLVATDNGKVVMTSSGGWVIPTGVMAQGNTVTLLNGDGSAQNVDASALNALYNTADGANIKANTITLGGASMATIWFGSGTFAYISATNMTVS